MQKGERPMGGFEYTPSLEMLQARVEYKGAFSYALERFGSFSIKDVPAILEKLGNSNKGIIIRIKDRIFSDEMFGTMPAPSSAKAHVKKYLNKEVHIKDAIFYKGGVDLGVYNSSKKNKRICVSFDFKKGESSCHTQEGNVHGRMSEPLTPAIIKDFAELLKEFDLDLAEVIIYPITDIVTLMQHSGW